MAMWRQGDVLICSVPSLPADAKSKAGTIMVRGEATGHSHRVQDQKQAELWTSQGVLYLRVKEDGANIVHEEHGTLQLPQGTYKVWQQREYTPEAIRKISD